jgi:hypothetical protein
MPSRFIGSKRVARDPDVLAHHLAYNARCAVRLGEGGKLFDFHDEAGHHAGGLIHPDHIARLELDRTGIWETLLTNAYSEQEMIALSLIATLPREGELNDNERIALIAAFCEPIRQAGHVIDWQLHRGFGGNWHVHFLISTRDLRPDGQTEALSDSPFHITARPGKNKNERSKQDKNKSADEGGKTIRVLNPPWQRLWRVTQDRFFMRRGIPLRVPASTYRAPTDPDQQDDQLEPASRRGGYATRDRVDTWRAARRECFSSPDHYLAALTRDRLIIDQHGINAFNNMVFGDQPLPAAIAEIFTELQSDDAGPTGCHGEPRGICFENGTFTSPESDALLRHAIRTTRILDCAEFDDGMGEPHGFVPGYASIVCAGSIGMVSARDPVHLLPIDAKALQSHGLTPFLDALPRHITPLFITPDHLSYRRHGAALKARGWEVKGISELLKPEFVGKFGKDKGYQYRDVMLIMLDAQRLNERRLASLICVADMLRRERGRLRLLLLKPDDVAAEPIARLMDWLSRSLRHFFISAPNGNSAKPLARADEINTFAERFPEQFGSRSERTIRFDELPPQPTGKDGRRAYRAAILRFLRKKRYLGLLRKNRHMPGEPARKRHRLILIGSPDQGDRSASGRLSSLRDQHPPREARAIRASQLSRRCKAMITAEIVIGSPGQRDRTFGAGTVVTIVDVDTKNGVFWFTDPKTGDPLSVPTTRARDFLPLDLVNPRDAFVIADHFDKVVKQLDVQVYVIVIEREHADQLIALAHRFERNLMKVVVDKQLCASKAELVDLIERSPLLDTIDAMARAVDAEPEIRAIMRNYPDAITLGQIDDEMIAEAEAQQETTLEQPFAEAQPNEPQRADAQFTETKVDDGFALDPFPEPDAATPRSRRTTTNTAPGRRAASWQTTDDGDHEDDIDTEKILRDSHAIERNAPEADDDQSVFNGVDRDTGLEIPDFWRKDVDPDPDPDLDLDDD